MNFITKYQANEIAKKSRAEINASVFEFLKEDYESEGSTRKIVDSIFDKIRSDAADGFFESSIDLSFDRVDDDVDFYKDYSVLIERSFNHLGYIVDSIPLKNELRLFISWE
jgi:hypothetical protein